MDTSGTFKSEEDLAKYEESKTDSFWEIGNYKHVVKRIEDSLRLCTDLTKMAQERAEIESKYAKSLQHWSKKWEELVTKGPEYGSTEVGWKSGFQEAVKIADIHMEISQKISDEIMEGMHAWKNSHYHKSIVHLKETKRAEEGFSTAQKPWAKKLLKCIRTKKHYHQCAKEVEILANQVHTADVSPEISAEQCQKLRAKHEKAETERDRALEKYKDRLGEVQRYKCRYEEDMTMQFSKCQESELARMEFFKVIFCKLEGILDITKTNRVNEVYTDYKESLDRISPEDDLRWYAINYGTGMSYSWPEYEEYVTGQTKTSTLSTTPRPSPKFPNNLLGGTTGTFSHVSEPSSSDSSSPAFNSAWRQDTFDDNDEDEWLEPPPTESESPEVASGSRSGSEEPQGRLMRALYDYTGAGQSNDDLNFKEGDLVRIMYEGKDGWAEGSMGDKYGYVPISYFEPV